MSQDARTEEEQATQRRAAVLGANYYDTSLPGEKQLYKDLLTIPELRQRRIIPLQVADRNLLFGITTTTSQQTISQLREQFQDYVVDFAIISEAGFRDYMHLYDPPKQVVYQDIAISQAGNADLVQQVSQMLDQVRADDMLGYLVAQAHKLNASDIHIETQAEDIRVRFRIDGVLHPIAHIAKEKYHVLLSEIASAGDVSTGVDEAQQGRISQQVTMADGTSVDINVRLETVPTVNGIDVVMRLFNMDASMYTLDRLGLSELERHTVDGVISKPSGLVMVVGPTGSGKTTTLYSMLNALNSDSRKIITIEDPVEYSFAGITQIPIHSSQAGDDGSFAEKLRAVLRLDPDVVMVGEIRDNDTAKTALQASLTGHLVLATFHAGSAAAALTRIADIIGQNPLFISAIRLVMAQRLIRKLDDSIKQPYAPSESELATIHGVLDTLPENYPRPNMEGLQLYKPGKSEENPYGYQGQIAIREQFTMSDLLQQLLSSPKVTPTAQTIEATAIKSGMLTMLQDGMLKVLRGETTMEELFRVVG